ncbi:FtsW/RodA/SpoVE family cell cycle protein, partial [Patescibacteria group bacterium]|nr:FtsW/RodA/SpoVE family cell cycle protein [Patescibacteria group bacterium]
MKRTVPKSSKFYYYLLAILLFGLLMVYNASPLYSYRLFGTPYYFARLQLIWILVGLLVFFVVSSLNLQVIKWLARGMFVAAVLALIFLAAASLFYPCSKVNEPSADLAFCPCKNGARRWINLNPPPLPQIPLLGTLGFQASDLVKLAVVIYLPLLLEAKLKMAKHRYEAFFFFFGYCALVSLLILIQPNMSNAGLIMMIGIVIYFVSGAELKPLAVLLPVGLVAAGLFVLISPYRRERFLTLVSPDEQSALNESYQSTQILIGLGSGGPFGVGVGQSKQKQHYLPEVIGDSIFAIIGEEMGFVGSLAVVIGFALLTLEMVKISVGAVTHYEKMAGLGVCAWI